MNTPAHLLIGAAVFGRPATTRILAAAFAGAMLPDLSLYLMAGVSLLILDIPPQVVFGELYYSRGWQTVFAIDNSFFVWGALLALALWQRSGWAVVADRFKWQSGSHELSIKVFLSFARNSLSSI